MSEPVQTVSAAHRTITLLLRTARRCATPSRPPVTATRIGASTRSRRPTIQSGRCGGSELSRALEHKAFHDPLTGLANRLPFVDRVKNARSRRQGSAAVIYIDLDDFNTINDTLGHDAGDELLIGVADRLRGSLRAEDTPARLGGDEFAVLLLDIQPEYVRVVAERLLAALSRPVEVAGSERPIHASLGVALATCQSMGADELIRNADTAMYVSKHGGKRGYSIYENGMEQTSDDLVGAASTRGRR